MGCSPRDNPSIQFGRTLHQRWVPAPRRTHPTELGLYAANSIFVGDYLTTKGQAPEADYRMLREMGFEIVRNPEAAAK